MAYCVTGVHVPTGNRTHSVPAGGIRPVKSQGDVTIPAAESISARGAEYEITVASTIQEQNCLFFSFEGDFQPLGQRLTDQIDPFLRDTA